MALPKLKAPTIICICYCFIAITWLGCETASNSQPDLSAIPHAEALPATELSAEDKAKLSQAAGKTNEKINATDLQNMLNASEDVLHVYVFWNKDCKACIENIQNLKSYRSNNKPNKMKVITINVGDNINDADLGLRSENIPFDAYHLNSKNRKWTKLIDEEWNGDLPVILMVNKTEELFLKYYRVISVHEMEAILQTLVI